MADLQTRQPPKIGPSDSSDTYSDRPNEPGTDSDMHATGERVTVGKNPQSELHNEHGVDRVVDAMEAGLGGGLDQAEEGQLGVTDDDAGDAEDEEAGVDLKTPKRTPKP